MALARGVAGYIQIYERNPWTTSFATCFVKGAVADIIAQRVLDKRRHAESKIDAHDWRRTLAFAVYSGAYCGCAQHWIYNSLYARLFTIETTVAVALKKVSCDCFVHAPLVASPCYYFLRPVMEGRGSIVDGVADYKRDFWTVGIAFVKVWGPAHMCTFTVVPPPMRIAFIASVSLGWLSLMSFFAHDGDDGDDEGAEGRRPQRRWAGKK